MALITFQRCSELVPNFNSNDTQVLTDILAAASETIERYCNRTFAVTQYDDLYDGSGYANLLVDNYPITAISRIAIFPVQALQIQNAMQAVARAPVRLDATNLYLSAFINAVETDVTIALASCPMLSDLANAINSYSSLGFKSLAIGPFSTFPTSDLRPPQGAFDCRLGTTYLSLHYFSLWQFDYNPNTGEITSSIGFPPGYRNCRVIYSAGYAVIPNSLQQACAELAVLMYQARGQNANVASESLGGYSYSNIAEKSFGNLSLGSKTAIEQYRNRRFVRYKV